MSTLARIGGCLLIAGILIAASFVVRGILGVLEVMPIMSDGQVNAVALLLVLGSGAAAIGSSVAGPLAAQASRIGLGLFAVGSFSLALAIDGAQDSVPGSLGVAEPLLILGIAGVLVPIGLAVIGLSLVRSSGLGRVAGLSICVGGAVAGVGLYSSSVLGYDASRAILVLGAALLGVGMVGVGLLAIAGSPGARGDA